MTATQADKVQELLGNVDAYYTLVGLDRRGVETQLKRWDESPELDEVEMMQLTRPAYRYAFCRWLAGKRKLVMVDGPQSSPADDHLAVLAGTLTDTCTRMADVATKVIQDTAQSNAELVGACRGLMDSNRQTAEVAVTALKEVLSKVDQRASKEVESAEDRAMETAAQSALIQRQEELLEASKGRLGMLADMLLDKALEKPEEAVSVVLGLYDGILDKLDERKARRQAI